MSQSLLILPTHVVTGALLTFRSIDLLATLVTSVATTFAGRVPRTKVPLPDRTKYLIRANWPSDIRLALPPILTVTAPPTDRVPVPLVIVKGAMEGLPKLPRSMSRVVAAELPSVGDGALKAAPATVLRTLSAVPSATTIRPLVAVPVGMLRSSLPPMTTLEPL